MENDIKETTTDLTSSSVNCDTAETRIRLSSALSLSRQPVGGAEHSCGRSLTTAAQRRLRLIADSARPAFDNLSISAPSLQHLLTENMLQEQSAKHSK